MSDQSPVAWDDARLAAAFQRHAASAPAAPDLAAETVARLRSAPNGRSWRTGRRSWTALGGLAAAAVVVIALAAWPRTSSTPPVGQAVAIADLPVIEVPELIGRMADPQPDEVIVHGWFAVAPVEADCEVVEDPHPLIPDCEEWYRFLMAEPETLGGVRGGPIEPVGDHVIPMLRIDSHIGIVSESGETVEVLAVGHIADHRTKTCPEADLLACARRFVIDRLLPADADIVALPDPWSAAAPPVDAPEAVVDALVDAVGPLSVASIGTTPAAELPSIEPITAGDEPAGEELLWVVRALVDGSTAPRTFVVVDETAGDRPRISEVTAAAVLDVPMPSDDPNPSGDPTSVLGLPIIDVLAALEVRDRGEDSTELAVRGWFSPLVPVPCPYSPTSVFLEPVCTSSPWVVLTAGPEARVTVTRNAAGTVTYGSADPTGPSIGLIFAGLDRSWMPDLPTSGSAAPIDVVLVGHFDDDRSTFCPDDQEVACRDRFVVDRVAMADGREPIHDQPAEPGTTASSHADVVAAVKAVAGDDVLGVEVIEGSNIRQEEPSVLTHPQIGPRDRYWIVRVLEGSVAVRYLVIDGSDAVFRLGDGAPTLVAGTPPPFEVPGVPPESESPFVGGMPTEVAGLPVVGFGAAREVRARPGDDSEIAVGGWFQHPPNFDCLAEEEPSVLLRGCVGDLDEPHLVDEAADPVLHLVFPTPISQPPYGTDPVPGVVVGHFDDRRASVCPFERRSECQDAFVVDAIWFDGRLGDGAWDWFGDAVGPPPQASRDLVNRTVRSIVPGPEPRLLAVGAIRGRDLPQVEPAASGVTFTSEPWVWHITVLVDDRVRTILITDADLLRRQEVGGDWEWFEVVGDQLIGTGADIN